MKAVENKLTKPSSTRVGLQKVMLIASALITTLPMYAITPAGAAGATAGALIGAYIIGKAVSTHYKHTHEDLDQCDACKDKKRQRIEAEQAQDDQARAKKKQHVETKKALRKDIKEYKKALSKEKTALKKVQKQDKKEAKRNKTTVKPSAQATTHQSVITELEQMVNDLTERLKELI
jgi:hypothetical protein